MTLYDTFFSGKRWQRRLGYIKARLLGRTRAWAELHAFARHVADYKWIDGATGRDTVPDYPSKLFKVMTEGPVPFTYKNDTETDQWRHPLAFMFAKIGDCEDWSAFMAECLVVMGYTPSLAVIYYQQDGASGKVDAAHCVCVFSERNNTNVRAISNWGVSVAYQEIRFLVTDRFLFPGFTCAEILDLALNVTEEVLP